ncbi:hypothetical protein ACFWP2_21880 [Kitasatospora sp. NPDC058444]|uniref:hypothetical protein n=1 Tax=Kitasatospora sp. NPDC058444 TaxID=3346504 RepID=UPI00365512CA
MFDRGLAKGCLGAVVGLAALVGVVFALYIGLWIYICPDDPYASKPGPERVRLTAAAFRERSQLAVENTVGGLSHGLALSDTGYGVRQYERRPEGGPSTLSFVDRQLTARTRISASHREELKNGIEAAWRSHGYKQEQPIWTPGDPLKGPDYHFSAEVSADVAVYVTLTPEPDQTLTLTLSVRGAGVEYDPDSAQPTTSLRPDLDDAHWSH